MDTVADPGRSPSVQSASALFARMLEGHQLSAIEVETLQRLEATGERHFESEDEVLQWLAEEYDLGYTPLDNVSPDRQLLALTASSFIPKTAR